MFDSLPTGMPALAAELQADMGRMFRQLGVESFRASVIDLGAMALQDIWTLGDGGQFTPDNPDRPLDSLFPGVNALVTQLASMPADDTLAQRLSPRHRVFAWRIDGVQGVLAEARYRSAEDGDVDSNPALVRLVGNIGILARQQARLLRPDGDAAGGIDGEQALAWSAQEEAPARSGARASLALRAGLPLSLAAALLATWLAVAGLPALQRGAAAQQAEAHRLTDMAERTVARALATALATGDYGEVQAALSSFEALGYFRTAAVLNLQNRVVSTSGRSDGLRIGDPAPAPLVAASRAVPLSLGSNRVGQLLLPQEGAGASVDAGLSRLWAALAALAAGSVAVLLGQRWWRGLAGR